LKEQDTVHCEILHMVNPVKKNNPNPQNITLETIKQDDKMEFLKLVMMWISFNVCYDSKFV